MIEDVLSIPDDFNAAAYFVDRHVDEGRGDDIAIECGDERVTYHRLLESVNRAGSALRTRLGVAAGERVALLLHDTAVFPACFFGAMKIGAIPVPLNTLLKPADYQYVLNDMQARVAILSAALLPSIASIRRQLPHLEHLIVADAVGSGATPAGVTDPPPTLEALLADGIPELDAAPTSKDDPAVWLYSSGSTGAPKACVHRHRDPVFAARAFGTKVLGVSASDRTFSAAKLFFAYGLGNSLFLPFAAGGRSILLAGQPTAASVAAVVERYRPTLFYWVPTGYAMLLAHHDRTAPIDFSSVRAALSAGEALPPAIFERFKDRFGIEILDGIGATETMHNVIANPPGRPRPGSSGVVVPGYEARILDDGGRPVAAGDIGNLFVRGASICAGYWNQPDKTRDTFADGWFRTGDKFHQDADGYFFHHGRSDDMLKVGGMWVSPVDVERALLDHPAVQECAVAGREDADRLVKPCAFVVLARGAAAGPALADELQQFATDRLPRYQRPRWVEFVDALPKTATGKIQRFKLRRGCG